MNERVNGILKSFLAGVAIALGGYVYLSCENKYVGAFLFSVGLLTVLYFGLNRAHRLCFFSKPGTKA